MRSKCNLNKFLLFVMTQAIITTTMFYYKKTKYQRQFFMSNDSWKWFTPILMITTIVGFAWYLWNSSDDLDFKILKQTIMTMKNSTMMQKNVSQ